MKKHQHLAVIVVLGVVFATLVICCWMHTPVLYSDTERRVLAQFPEWSTESVVSGTFSSEFEDYSADQFPLRDRFRQIKIAASLLLQGEYENYYLADGHVGKLEYPKNSASLDYAAERFQRIYDRYLKENGMTPYFAVIPDKNAFLAEQNGYVALDYSAFCKDFQEKLPAFTHLNLFPYLSLEDYYQTDPHWRQEKIVDVADYLAKSMGTTISDEYEVQSLSVPFRGTYAQQINLSLSEEPLCYLTYPYNLSVYHLDSGRPEEKPLYDLEKAAQKDAYDLYLSGAVALLTIENPDVRTNRELIVFRDSFGSSIAPLLSGGYQKITLVDLRYVDLEMLSAFIDFSDQDVLFLYSTTILNNSFALK